MQARKRTSKIVAKSSANDLQRTTSKTGHLAKSNRKPLTLSKFAPLSTDPNSKIAILVSMLRKKAGATITDMADAVGWQNHSVRGALSGIIKKKFGLKLQSLKSGNVRTYRITE